MKTLTFDAAATRQLRKLQPQVRERILEKLGRYAEGGAGDIKALVGRPGSRLRIGDWRVVFTESADEISVRAVGNRREIYD